MALPPNELTNLLRGTPEQIFNALHQQGCLPPTGQAEQQGVERLIDQTLQEYGAFREQNPGWCGPTAADKVAEALLASPYLNEHARRLYNARA